MNIIYNPTADTWNKLISRPALELDFLDSTVRNILNRVRQGGDRALLAITAEIDKVELPAVELAPEKWQAGANQLDPALQAAIQQAAHHIEIFHAAQKRLPEKITTAPGVVCWREARAIEKVGIYIPGGTAPLFSTVLMLAIPARLAGCTEIVLATPPSRNGDIDPAILYAAQLTGVTRIIQAGGAQAIGALAYGTESVPAVHKIFGPGNQFVTKAKQLVNQEGIAIDMPAGPSEVLVYADQTATPAFVAADLLSQAEHGTDSQVILLTTTATVLEAIRAEVEAQLERLPRKEIARQALQHSAMITFDYQTEAIRFINAYAPEHLILNVDNADEILRDITHAGSVFLGNYTPEAAGDYASGTNHTLPTNGHAKAYGGVALESFLRYITIQKISADGARRLGPVVVRLAEAEGLEGHAQAMRLRM